MSSIKTGFDNWGIILGHHGVNTALQQMRKQLLTQKLDLTGFYLFSIHLLIGTTFTLEYLNKSSHFYMWNLKCHLCVIDLCSKLSSILNSSDKEEDHI